MGSFKINVVYPIRNQIAYRLDANMAWKMLNIQEYRKMRGQDWEFTLYPTYEKLVAQ